MENMESFWEEVKCQIRTALPDHSYRMWIDPVQLIELENECVYLSTPNAYFVKRLKANYLPLIRDGFDKLGLNNLKIQFKIDSKNKSKKNQ